MKVSMWSVGMGCGLVGSAALAAVLFAYGLASHNAAVKDGADFERQIIDSHGLQPAQLRDRKAPPE